MVFDASEIGLDWRGSLQNLASVPQSKCSLASSDGRLKDHTGKYRCELIVEETIADNTLGKLVWAKRRSQNSEEYVDHLVKRPVSQAHAKQEAVIQWLCHTCQGFS